MREVGTAGWFSNGMRVRMSEVFRCSLERFFVGM